MSESKEDKEKKPLTLGAKPGGTLSLKGNAGAQARQSLAGGGRGTVVEVRRRRAGGKADEAQPQQGGVDAALSSELQGLSAAERDARAKALREALAARLTSAIQSGELPAEASVEILADLFNAMIFTGVLRRNGSQPKLAYSASSYVNAAVELIAGGARQTS